VRLSRNLCLGPHVEPEKHSARVTQPNLIVSASPQVDAREGNRARRLFRQSKRNGLADGLNCLSIEAVQVQTGNRVSVCAAPVRKLQHPEHAAGRAGLNPAFEIEAPNFARNCIYAPNCRTILHPCGVGVGEEFRTSCRWDGDSGRDDFTRRINSGE